MAQAVEIRLWCDGCLEHDEHTPGETITVPALFGQPAFELEACGVHAKALRDAVEEMRPWGRSPEKTPKAVPSSSGRTRPDQKHTGPMSCPVCGESRASLAALRSHLRDIHEKSLADVGLARVVFVCSTCGGGFEHGQGFSAHRRATHPEADPDGRAVAQKRGAA